MRLQGKRVVVTGGASGIGAEISARFSREGAAVLIADLDEDGAERRASDLASSGAQTVAVRVDVTDERLVGGMVKAAHEAFGGIDVLVNNANGKPSDDLMQMSPQQWDRDVEMTLRGPYLCTRAVLPEMLERGGSIVNIASVNGLGFYGNEAYSAAKAGLISLTRSVAVRYGNRGVRANAVAPGTVRTPIWDDRLALDPEVFEKVGAWYPLQRVGEAADVANAALFLASDEAAWVTGAVLPVDGGLTAGSYRMTVDILPESEL